MSSLICPVCDNTDIDQYRMPTGPIWCRRCGLSVPKKEKFNPFVSDEEEIEGDVLKPTCTGFNTYARYLAHKERDLKKAISNAIDVLYIPIACESDVEVRVKLVEVTELGASFCKQFIVGDVHIDVDLKF